MTNKEYILNSIGSFGVTSEDADIILIKANLNPDDLCNNSKAMRECDMAIYNRMSVILKGCAQNVTEGGYAVSWNIDAVKTYYQSLCKELGVKSVLFTKPKLINRSNLW